MNGPPRHHDRPTVIVDGGDKACGELLLVLARRLRPLSPGSVIRLVATDPAAVIDLPAWCHLTGHRYLARGLGLDDRPYYDVQTTASPHLTEATDPWRLNTPPAATSHSKDTRS